MAFVTSSSESVLQSLIDWNSTNAEYPRPRCIHQLFAERAKKTPQATALVFKDQRLTYEELDKRTNQLARYLQRSGVGPDVLVGICMHRKPAMIIAVLGTLKAGGAYVPLDPAYPQKRLSAMLSEITARILLTEEYLADRLPPDRGDTVVYLDKENDAISSESADPVTSAVTANNLAYVIFTSGSTGKAKAAGVYHRGWTNLLHWFVSEFAIVSLDKILLVSSFSFDITQRSIAMPLISGGELHLLASETYDPLLILRTIHDQKITVMNCAPSTFYPVIENPVERPFQKLRSLRMLFLGGEPISASRLREWAECDECATGIANVYGTAECSDVSTYYRLRDFNRYSNSSVPIGKPIFNSQVYLLDESLNPVRFGDPGEICIAGEGVGKGYINDPELTQRQFVPNPFAANPNSRLYRTGDLGRFLPDWTLEFVGRSDHQVKLRGFRIDLGDIEAALRQHSNIREAVVLLKGFGPSDQRLIAYLVPNKANITREQLEDDLRPYLKDKLPEYMMPSAFVRLEDMPLNPNGKIDRSALLELDATAVGVTIGNEEPRNLVEREVASIIARTLKQERVGIFDNFFEIGGNSFLLTEVIAPVCVNLQTTLSIADFLAGPTVAQIAARIDELKKVDA